MAYRRPVAAGDFCTGDDLTGMLVGIGMNFASPAFDEPNIEDTLLGASVEGMENDDLRVLSVLCTWLHIHSKRINANRLIRSSVTLKSKRVRAFWTAFSVWKRKDRRLKGLQSLYRGPRIDVLRVGTGFQIERRGEDERFENTPLRIPKGVLRNRMSDVLTPSQLVNQHIAYRYRVSMGPSYRADMWAALELNPTLTPAELARKTYGSFASAWQTKKDFNLLSESAAGRS